MARKHSCGAAALAIGEQLPGVPRVSVAVLPVGAPRLPRLKGALLILVAGAVAVATGAGVARAAPPPNDGPAQAGAFQPVTAANGTPHELEAFADLAEARPDRRVPRCLGRSSFARTVWFRVPEAPTPQEVSVEASGRTLAVADLAAFVQPGGGLVRPLMPNACSGLGAGGADAAAEPTAGVTLRVAAHRSVLIQVGRRGRPGPPDDERELVSLDAQPLPDFAAPPGDFVNARTPKVRARGGTPLPLYGSTIDRNDPAQPACPSLGSVWRQVTPKGNGSRLITVTGGSTLAVFRGRRPTGDNVLDCVNRESRGALQMRVQARRGRRLWIRVGSDNPSPGTRATLHVTADTSTVVVDGGPGGFDPTTGGAGGGLPPACASAAAERARISGFHAGGLAFRLRVRGSSVCDAQIQLVRRGHVYAATRAIRLRGRPLVVLHRTRRLARGFYRLRVSGLSSIGRRVAVRTRATWRMR
jgi:hypothetical protein